MDETPVPAQSPEPTDPTKKPVFPRRADGKINGRPLGLPKYGGRQKGTKNKATVEIQNLARRLLNDREYLKNLRIKLRDHTIDPGIHRMLYQYRYGRPPDKVEISGPNGGPIESKVQFYIPSNGREQADE